MDDNEPASRVQHLHALQRRRTVNPAVLNQSSLHYQVGCGSPLVLEEVMEIVQYLRRVVSWRHGSSRSRALGCGSLLKYFTWMGGGFCSFSTTRLLVERSARHRTAATVLLRCRLFGRLLATQLRMALNLNTEQLEFHMFALHLHGIAELHWDLMPLR